MSYEHPTPYYIYECNPI